MSRTTTSIAISCLFAASVAAACAPATSPPTSENLKEDPVATGEGVSGSLTVGSQLRATGNVNLRTGPSTSYKVLHVVPVGSTVTVQASSAKNGYYQVKHAGTLGWSYGKYYEPIGGAGSGLAVGTALTATGNVNLRTGPSTSYQILDVVTKGSVVTVLASDAKNGFLNLDYAGTSGWSSAKYYEVSSSGGGGGPTGGDSGGSGGSSGSSGSGGSGGSSGSGTTAASQAMARAEAGVGFSYWWGHGRFRPEGPNGNAGSCSGSCPSCSHSGSYGADCSGYVAKVWQVPSSNADLTSDGHPYSTASFNDDTSQWSTVSRSNLKKADALVYRSGGAGHVFLYSKGDGWGSIYAYECKGCSAGCVKGYRTASSAYHAIRRAGY